MALGQIVSIEYKKSFRKQFRKLPPKIQTSFFGRSEVFKDNPFDLSLNNHLLTGNWVGFRSINITGDYRAIYKELSYNSLKFYAIGTHGQLYG